MPTVVIPKNASGATITLPVKGGGAGAPPPAWIQPRLADALTPNANGASRDPQGFLTAPIVETAPGQFQFTMNSGPGFAVNPLNGPLLEFPMVDSAGTALAEWPYGVAIRVSIVSPFPALSSAGLAVGILPKEIINAVATEHSVWGGAVWTTGGLKAAAGRSTSSFQSVNLSPAITGMVGWKTTTDASAPYDALHKGVYLGVTSDAVDAAGLRIGNSSASAAFLPNVQFGPGTPPTLFISLLAFTTGVAGSVELAVEYMPLTNPDGSVL